MLIFIWFFSKKKIAIAPPFTIGILLVGAVGLFSGEFVREIVRKPYTIENFLYSNNNYKDQIDEIRESGIIASSKWPKYFLSRKIPRLFDEDGNLKEELIDSLTPEEKFKVGETIFQYQCGTCHTRYGYNSLLLKVRGTDPEILYGMIEELDEINPFMPPWAGKGWEAEFLAKFLYKASEGQK